MINISYFIKGAGRRQRQVFTSTGSFTVPNRVKVIDLIIVGAGASGNAAAGSLTNYAAGGCAGEIVMIKDYGVTGGNTITVTIGTGGAGVTVSGVATIGNSGGNSSFGAIIAQGGFRPVWDNAISNQYITNYGYKVNTNTMYYKSVVKTIGSYNTSRHFSTGCINEAIFGSTYPMLHQGCNLGAGSHYNISNLSNTYGYNGANGFMSIGGQRSQTTKSIRDGKGYGSGGAGCGGPGTTGQITGDGAPGLVIVYYND